MPDDLPQGFTRDFLVLQERDVGLFSVLFRTKQSIDQYTLGVEFELYRCTLVQTEKMGVLGGSSHLVSS